jgi:hypothetical protein
MESVGGMLPGGEFEHFPQLGEVNEIPRKPYGERRHGERGEAAPVAPPAVQQDDDDQANQK